MLQAFNEVVYPNKTNVLNKISLEPNNATKLITKNKDKQ